jgi:hypothetical protein
MEFGGVVGAKSVGCHLYLGLWGCWWRAGAKGMVVDDDGAATKKVN